ncbi:hypothetical protein [Streptosporangium sp. NPDC001681]|uniref:hypothetical protein n=1 Tax=Streptosporangium sp. NPDC001681 TaxID=3154395 RepID=UPI0033258A5D
MPEDNSPELHVTFNDHFTPHATAGIYTVRARQELYKENGERIDTGEQELPESAQRFEIRPVRFVLKSASVHALYPPAGSAGRYDTVLPHITLSRAVLPWERELTGTRAREHAPWLALLVFAEGELPGDESAMGQTTRRTVADLVDPAEAGVIGPNLSGPSLTPEVLSSKCETIDVPAGVFRAVVPYQDELYYLAHVRDVNVPTLRQGGEDLVEGRYAVITANRFARVPGRYAVHLVSLEGYEPHAAPNPPTGHDAVRLCALWSWSFHHAPDTALDIPGLITNLVAPSRTDPDNLALRVNIPAPESPPDEAETYARERLRLGYAPVPFRTLSGEATYAWYRGPFTPVTAPQVPDPGLAPGHTTADHALIYEQEHGLFDVSYAAAWTLGRTLALADPDYAAQLARARREIANRAAVLRKITADPARAGRSLETGRSLRALRELAETAGGQALAAALAAPQAAEPLPRRPRRRSARLTTDALLADERSVSALRETAEEHVGSMPEWLEGLSRFAGVPFAYLVPDGRMLPPESLRLFRIDLAWVQAVLAGAADVGLHTFQDRALDAQIRSAVGRRRSAALPAAGLLIYSTLVRAWPDFPIFMFADGAQLAELRRERLADDVLLYLFDAVPDRIEIREPGQGIHFGLDHGDVISLRSLGGTGRPPLGKPLEETFPERGDGDNDDTVFTRYLRPRPEGQTRDVLRLRGTDGFVPGLAAALGRDDLSPGEFALQLVNTPIIQELRPLPERSS